MARRTSILIYLMHLSLVLPCFDEEANIERVVRDAFAWFQSSGIDGEVVVTNDGSRDRTEEILERLKKEFPHLKVVHHTVNRGYGAALTSACDSATKEFIAFIDSDGQFQSSDLQLLLPHLKNFSFVTGYRKKRADPLPRIINAALYGFLLRAYVGLRVRDVNCAMKVFRSDLWLKIRPEATGALFNAEVFLALQELGIPWKEVPVPHYPRTAGRQTGAKLSVIFRMFRELAHLKRRRTAMKAVLPLLDKQ